MTGEERALEAATLAMNSAVEVADIVAAGGPLAFEAAIGVTLRTGEQLAALNRGERVPAFTVTGEPREVVVVIPDGRRIVGRRVNP